MTNSIRPCDGGTPDIDVLVAGVEDEAIAVSVQNIIRSAFRERDVTGSWVVALGPSDMRGRWDLALKGPSGRHVLSLTASLQTLLISARDTGREYGLAALGR